MEEKLSQETLTNATNNNLSQLPSSNLEEDSLIIKDFKEISICYEPPPPPSPSTSTNPKTLLESSSKQNTNLTKIHNMIWGKSKASEYKTAYYNARTKVEWKPFNKTTFTSISKLKTHEEKLASPSWLKNREIMLKIREERLKQIEREKDPDQLTDYEKLKLKLKTTLKAIKKWELKFKEKMGKKPSKEEIDQLPKVKAMYQSFQSLSKKVKEFEISNPDLVVNKSTLFNQTIVSGINQSTFNTTNNNMSKFALNGSAFDITLLNGTRVDNSILTNNNINDKESIMDVTLPITSNLDNSILNTNNISFSQSSKVISPPEDLDTRNISILEQNTSFMDNSILNTSRIDNSILNLSNISYSQGLKIIGPPKASEVETNLPFKSPKSQNQSQSPSESNNQNQILSTLDNDQSSLPANDLTSDIPTSDIWEFDIPSSQRSIIPEDHPLNKVYTQSPYYYNSLVNEQNSNINEHLDNWLLTTQTLMKKYFPNIEEEIKIELRDPSITLTEPLAPKHPLLHVIPGYHASTKRLRSQLSSEVFDDQRDYSLNVEPYHDWEDEIHLQSNNIQDSQIEEFTKEVEDEASKDKTTATRVNRSARTTRSTTNLTKKDLVSDNFVKLNTRSNRYKPKLASGKSSTSRFSKNYFKRK